MNTKIIGIALLLCLLTATAMAQEVSVQIKRTTPGITGETSGEIVFDIVNSDLNHQLEGFILCRSPDDATVSSSLGVGSGSGAQYVSPIFQMDQGPSQRSIAVTLDSEVSGKHRVACFVKYMPFKQTNHPNGKQTASERQYMKMNGDYIKEPTDSNYRIIRLDKAVPFSESTQEITQPEKAEVVTEDSDILDQFFANPLMFLVAMGMFGALLLGFMHVLGRGGGRGYQG